MSERTKTGFSLLLAAVVLGVLGDLLLRATPWGLNALLWAAALVAAIHALSKRKRLTPSKTVRFVFGSVLLFGACFAWRDSLVLKALDGLAIVIVITLAASGWRNGWVPVSGAAAYMAGFGKTVLNALFGSAPLFYRDINWQELPKGQWRTKVLAIGRGLAIAVPLLLVFVGLFAAADAVFQGYLQRIARIDTDRGLSHLFITALCTWLAGGLLQGWFMREQPGPENEVPLPFSLGITEIATVLGLLDILFLLFVGVQIKYLFGNHQLVQVTPHLTYSQYAVKGFWELVAAAALTIPILLHAHSLLKEPVRSARQIFAVLAGTMIVLVFVIIASAVKRMRLYDDAYGLTELRFYTFAIMGWMAAVFVWMGATVLTGHRSRFALGAITAGLAMIVGLHFVNPDEYIVRANTQRMVNGKRFDAWYNASLSADAVPALMDIRNNLMGMQEQDLENRLVVQLGRLQSSDWRSWSWSRQRARRILVQELAQRNETRVASAPAAK
jgi:hypothetical protein